jgi:hypothetical protein
MSGFDLPHWNCLQLLAWVYIGDRALVAECAKAEKGSGGYFKEVVLPDHTKQVALTPGEPPSVIGIIVAAVAAHGPSAPNIEATQREITDALCGGGLCATGIRQGADERAEMLTLAWLDLRINWDEGTAEDSLGRTRWRELRFNRTQIMSVFPGALENAPQDFSQAKKEALCLSWLLESENTGKPKKALQPVALSRFGISVRGFNSAFQEARGKSKGRPKKKQTRTV